MADSAVAITAGAGTSIDTRTEATNGNHRQVVVLGDPSTNAGVAPVDATNGLAVDVKALPASTVAGSSSLPAGTNIIGRVGTRSVRIAVTPTVSTSPAYSSADAVGGLMTFSNAVAVSGYGGVLQSVIVIDKANQKPALQIYISNQTFTASTDNAAFTVSDADVVNAVGYVSIAATDWQSNGTANAVATKAGIGLAFHPNTTDLFAQMQTTSTPTFASTSDIIVIFEILQD